VVSQKRLKILHLVYDHPDNPWCGGGGAQRSWAVNNILARKHDITVFCGAFPNPPSKNQPFKVNYVGKAKGYKESRIKFIMGSRRIDSSQYDIVVEDFSAFSPSLIKCRNIPEVSIIHYYLGLSAFKFRPILGIIAFLSEKIILRKKSSFILVSEHLQDILPHGSRSTAISPGVKLPDFLPEPSEEYVLFLGRLDIEIKGLDTLIKAWSLLPKDISPMPLYIAGGGDQSEIQRLIRDQKVERVTLIGHLEHDKAIEAVNKAAFVCIPSRMEGCGIVLYESLALGKPVIASAIPSFENIISDNNSGILIPPGDHQALAAAIEKLINDSTLRSRLSKGAIEIGKDFKWETAAALQEQFYLESL